MQNKSTLPEKALYIIRFHSFYPFHQGGAYKDLMDDMDREMLHWVKVNPKTPSFYHNHHHHNKNKGTDNRSYLF